MAGGIKLEFKIGGTREVERKIGRSASASLADALDKQIERSTLMMVNDAKENAPYKTGNLKRSIMIDTSQTKRMSRTFGSHVPYAKRQEYENQTHKAFFRNAVWNNEASLQKALEDEIRRALG